MGEVRRRDDERPSPGEDIGQGRAEAAGQGRIRLADDRRDDLCLRKQDLDERDLDLDRVFAEVRSIVGRAIGVRGDQRRDGLLVHRGDPQGGPEAVARVEGDLPQTRLRVVRPEDDDDIGGPIPDLAVPVGADLTGVDVAGMGDDDGQGFFYPLRQGVLHELFDCEFQDGRRPGVESPRDSGRADIVTPTSRRAGDGDAQGEDEKQQTDAHRPHGGPPIIFRQSYMTGLPIPIRHTSESRSPE